MDESNVLDSGFLERMNTLLANGEVPGLFEGDDFTTLMTQCKEGSQREGLMLDSNEELYKWFTQQVSYAFYLHFHLLNYITRLAKMYFWFLPADNFIWYMFVLYIKNIFL